MWLGHWNLSRDPFPPGGGAYVATPPHEEAVAGIVRAIEAGEPLTALRAGAGMGKSMVVARALDLIRSPGLRVARVVAPADPIELLDGLARSLRGPARSAPGIVGAWRSLREGAQLIRAQRGRLLLVVDDAHQLADPTSRRHLERLAHLDESQSGSVVRVLVVERPHDDLEAADSAFSIPLPALTRSEAHAYLSAKLARAGRIEPIWTPDTLTQLHARAGGIPGRLDRLAGQILRIAASLSLSLAGPDVLDTLPDPSARFDASPDGTRPRLPSPTVWR